MTESINYAALNKYVGEQSPTPHTFGDSMIKTVSQIRDELADREAIRDCMYRYSRGIDRCDVELLRSAYWPDATDNHTGFVGTREEFIAWAHLR